MSFSYAVNGFLGGEVSQYYQGRFERPDYKISLNVCLNSFPVEIGAWTRRPGTQFAGTTLGGNPGRIISWSFEQSTPYTIEFTNGNIRFRQGAALVTNNDSQAVSQISTATPAVVTVTTSPASASTVVFGGLAANLPLLQNRQFTWTYLSSTTGSIADAITGAPIVGSTLGVTGLPATATMSSIQTLVSPYAGGTWATIRMVQAETSAFVLQGSNAPQVLTATALPMGSIPASFTIGSASFDDGPYLDPFTNGVMVTPNQTTGIVQLTLSFPPYVSTTSYAKGDFVTSSSVNYISIQDQNVGNTPASSATYWAPVTAAAAINPSPNNPNGIGRGFLSTDVGRLVRLFSEPALWLIGSTYSEGTVISYNPTGVPGAATYWQSLTSSNTGNIPGVDLINWELVAPGAQLPSIGTFTNPTAAAGPAQWTWGKIVSLLNFIPNAPSGIAQIGNLSNLGAAFNGISTQNFNNSANSVTLVGSSAGTLNQFVGQNYSGCSPAGYGISTATIFPSSDLGLAYCTNTTGLPRTFSGIVYLYGANITPSSYNSGTLLGSTTLGSLTLPGGPSNSGSLGTSAVTIVSNSVATYAYVWAVVSINYPFTADNDMGIDIGVAQVQLIATAGSGASASGVNVELIGPPLLYTTAIITWQLGAYSNTTGWPTCGCYAGGRLWLSGAIPNRFDACYANGIIGGEINFAPTDQYGNVTDAHGISLTLNSDGVNPIFWMQPDQQGILIGTQEQQWLVFGPGSGSITQNNIDARKLPGPGAANVLLRKTEHTYIYVQRYGVKLMEYFADIFSGKFTAPNLADKAQHITRAGIAEIAYTYGATPVIWGRDNNGALFGCTYKRDTLMTSQGPTYYAWHRHMLGSGRILTSIDAGPSVDGTLDALTMVTNQTSASDPQVGVYHVEIMTNTADELTPVANGWYLDDAVSPSSTVSTGTPQTGAPYGGLTLNGLWHLNGETVAVFAGGLDCGNYTVSNGSVFVPYGDSVSAGTGAGLFTATFAASGISIVVGFDYNSDGQLVRPIMPQETGTRAGPALGKKRRVQQAAALLSNASANVASNGSGQLGIQFGTSFGKMQPAIINGTSTSGRALTIAPGASYSGAWFDTIAGDDTFDEMLCWRVNRGLSGALPALEVFIDTKDK